jgi:hypothetical protein
VSFQQVAGNESCYAIAEPIDYYVSMASVFGDESSDETHKRVFAVAGLIGTDRQWEALKRNWLERTKGIVFHAADCESDQGDFKHNSHQANQNLYADLTTMMACSGLRGYGVAFDIGSWYQFFPNELPDWGYYMCFVSCIHYFSREQKHRDGTKMTFTFDHRMESEHNAGVLYDFLVNLPEWKKDNIFLDSTVNFGSPKNEVRLQAADLLARETMKGLDNTIGPKPRPIRKSAEALASAGKRFSFELLGHGFCKRWHEQINKDRAFVGGSPIYDQWLNEKKLTDNWSSRMRFLNWATARGWLQIEQRYGSEYEEWKAGWNKMFEP